MEIISARRFIARNLFDGERFQPLIYVDMSGGSLFTAPFERETAATVFIDGRVILLRLPSPSDDMGDTEYATALLSRVRPDDISTYPSTNMLAVDGIETSKVLAVVL